VNTKLARFAWFVLGYNLLVVLWGAYVRATGSGAGCGAHWPLCNGEVVPRAPTVEMIVEFSHRASSGLAFIAVLALLVWVFRAVPPGHPARRGAVFAMVFMVTEAGLGAGLVLFRLVADNPSLARAMAMIAHLANTFLLIASITLTAYWLSGGADFSIRRQWRSAGWPILGLVGIVAVGKSGAVAALGDTLYPVTSMAEGFAADLSPASNLLIRLRVLHPALAMVIGAALVAIAWRTRVAPTDRVGIGARRAVVTLVVVELAAGFLNLWLLAPVAMQIGHLLVADLLWIAMVLLTASALATPVSSSS